MHLKLMTKNSGIASPKFLEGKTLGVPECLNLGEQQYFCLGRHFSKHKMNRYAKTFAGHDPCPPGYAYAKNITEWLIDCTTIHNANFFVANKKTCGCVAWSTCDRGRQKSELRSPWRSPRTSFVGGGRGRIWLFLHFQLSIVAEL